LNFSWSLEIDHSTTSSGWTAADLDAFMVPEAESGLILAVGMLWLVLLHRSWQVAGPVHSFDGKMIASGGSFAVSLAQCLLIPHDSNSRG
jgi:hypothetical protein